MGCASSTEAIIDPVTGERKEKKRLGGAYPGQRPPQHAPYQPANFGAGGQATAHFVQYGGGNALVLQDGAAPAPQSGGAASDFISVTLPAGVNPGDTIHVQAPDGRLNAIAVPPGMSAGSTFTVEFAAAPSTTYNAPQKEQDIGFAPAVPAGPAQTGAADDFASGFGR